MADFPDPRLHMLTTYRALRRGLSIAGVLLPLGLVIGGWLWGLHVQDSMSQYYHADLRYQQESEQQPDLVRKASNIKTQENLTEAERAQAKELFRPGSGPLRNWFVGALFVVGALLVVYRGFLPDENTALNIAGFAAIGVALLPMPWGLGRSPIDEFLGSVLRMLPILQVPSVHYISAVTFFVGLAYVCFFCGAATLDAGVGAGLLTANERRYYTGIYRLSGVMMLAAPVAGLFVSHLPTVGHIGTFVTEAVGVAGFSLYWGVKSHELSKTKVDQMSADGDLEVVPSTSVLRGHKLRARTARGGGPRP